MQIRRMAVVVPIVACLLLSPIVANRSAALTAEQFWQRANEGDYKSPEELQAQHARELRKGVFYAKLMHGNTQEKTVALTFDDGPHPAYTLKILAILKQYNVKATFFVVGKMAKRYPALVREEMRGGNTIGNHTYDHVNLTKIPDSQITTEWRECNNTIKQITGQTPAFCRPPGGDYDKAVITAAQCVNLTTVLWTDDPGDYAKPGDTVIEHRVLDRVSNGGIILIHDGIQQTIDVLPQIIQSLQKRGFRFVTVDEMMRENADKNAKAASR